MASTSSGRTSARSSLLASSVPPAVSRIVAGTCRSALARCSPANPATGRQPSGRSSPPMWAGRPTYGSPTPSAASASTDIHNPACSEEVPVLLQPTCRKSGRRWSVTRASVPDSRPRTRGTRGTRGVGMGAGWPSGRPEVAVITMARDEGDLLSLWVSHYARHVGIDNLVVLDDNSVDGSTDGLGCTVHKVPPLKGGLDFEPVRMRLMNGIAGGLLAAYDYVVFVDVGRVPRDRSRALPDLPRPARVPGPAGDAGRDGTQRAPRAVGRARAARPGPAAARAARLRQVHPADVQAVGQDGSTPAGRSRRTR